MPDFEIVPDERRVLTLGRSRSALWDAVREGKTVFVQGAHYAHYNGYRQMLRAQGYRLHVATQRDPDGVLLWVDPLNGESKP